MKTTGYSDRINHALAFAAKHHDRQVRKGTRLPYLTRSANVAIILTRYGRDDETVVAGIIHDVVADCVRERYTPEMMAQRIGDKFGHQVLELLLVATERLADDDGVELSTDERRDDYLERVGTGSERARWVCAAVELHNGSTLLADLRRTIDPDTIWGRYAANKLDTIHWFRRVYDRLADVGFKGEIMSELGDVASSLEKWLGPTAPQPIADALGQP